MHFLNLIHHTSVFYVLLSKQQLFSLSTILLLIFSVFQIVILEPL